MIAKQVSRAPLALVTVGLIAISANVAWAAGRALYGVGTPTCGEWQRHRSTGNKGTTLQLQASIDGFLLGSGEEAPKATEVCIVEGGDGINYVCQ